jgi:hypothetical protein
MPDVEAGAVNTWVNDYCFIKRNLDSVAHGFEIVEMTQLSLATPFARDQSILLVFGALFVG